MRNHGANRREFLKMAGMSAAGLGLAPVAGRRAEFFPVAESGISGTVLGRHAVRINAPVSPDTSVEVIVEIS